MWCTELDPTVTDENGVVLNTAAQRQRNRDEREWERRQNQRRLYAVIASLVAAFAIALAIMVLILWRRRQRAAAAAAAARDSPPSSDYMNPMVDMHGGFRSAPGESGQKGSGAGSNYGMSTAQSYASSAAPLSTAARGAGARRPPVSIYDNTYLAETRGVGGADMFLHRLFVVSRESHRAWF